MKNYKEPKSLSFYRGPPLNNISSPIKIKNNISIDNNINSINNKNDVNKTYSNNLKSLYKRNSNKNNMIIPIKDYLEDNNDIPKIILTKIQRNYYLVADDIKKNSNNSSPINFKSKKKYLKKTPIKTKPFYSEDDYKVFKEDSDYSISPTNKIKKNIKLVPFTDYPVFLGDNPDKIVVGGLIYDKKEYYNLPKTEEKLKESELILKYCVRPDDWNKFILSKVEIDDNENNNTYNPQKPNDVVIINGKEYKKYEYLTIPLIENNIKKYERDLKYKISPDDWNKLIKEKLSMYNLNNDK